jgi:hypothetical protein
MSRLHNCNARYKAGALCKRTWGSRGHNLRELGALLAGARGPTCGSRGHKRTCRSRGHTRTCGSRGHRRTCRSWGHKRTCGSRGHIMTCGSRGLAATPLQPSKSDIQQLRGRWQTRASTLRHNRRCTWAQWCRHRESTAECDRVRRNAVECGGERRRAARCSRKRQRAAKSG